MFYRTIRLITNGIKPVYVFDGKPPTLKSGELAKRYVKRQEAEEGLAAAEEEGNAEEIEKMAKRTVKVSKTHNDEAKRLLRLMGVPVIEAPCEAEATCAALAKAGLVYAAGSEDMDTLTFKCPVLLRHLTFSEARKLPILEVTFEKMLEALKLNINEFVDLCILLGCDYCDTIKGVGPKRAWELIQEHRSIEKIIAHLDLTKHPLPEPFPYQDARELFLQPSVVDVASVSLEWTEPQEEELVKFLVTEKNFSEDRIRAGVDKLKKARQTSVQGRLTSFFGPPITKTSDTLEKKRAAEEEAKQNAKKPRAAAAAATKGAKRPAAKSSASAVPAAATAAAAAAKTTTTTTTTTEAATTAATKKPSAVAAKAKPKRKSKALFNNKKPQFTSGASSAATPAAAVAAAASAGGDAGDDETEAIEEDGAKTAGAVPAQVDENDNKSSS
jgi:flap endonuclease-1